MAHKRALSNVYSTILEAKVMMLMAVCELRIVGINKQLSKDTIKGQLLKMYQTVW